MKDNEMTIKMLKTTIAFMAEQFACIEAVSPDDLTGGTPLGEWAAARIGDLETENKQQADRIKELETALEEIRDKEFNPCSDGTYIGLQNIACFALGGDA